jgi:ankyrin repeat protein
MKRATWIGGAVAVMIAGAFLFSGCGGEGMTPLMLAAHGGNTPELKARIAAGDAVDARSRYGWTALMFAAWKGHREQVVMLLDAGADPNAGSGAVPSRFETVGGHPPSNALREAISSGHGDIARLLMDRGAKPDPGAVALAGGKGDIALLENLAKRGVDWNAPSESAFHPTALCSAASAGKRENAAWLLRHGAEPDVIAVEQTALKAAAYEDHPELVRLLLENGADPNLAFDRGRETALFSAVSKHTDRRFYARNLEVVKLLRKHGADPGFRVFGGKETILEFARKGPESGMRYRDAATDPEIRQRHEASIAHDEAVIRLLEN